MQSFLIPFFSILVAELFDKSQLSLLLLSTRVKNRLQLLIGAMIGFIIIDGLAVLLGTWITTIIPETTLSLIAGAIFIIIGIVTLRNATSKPKEGKLTKSAFLAGFLIIILTEWGDKTQLATAVFATQFQPILVFLGVIAALFVISAAAVFLGKFITTKVDAKIIHQVAGAAFIVMGAILIVL